MQSTDQSPERLIEICSAPPKEAQRLALVLHALSIPHHLLRAGQRVHILAPESHAELARRELEQYQEEAPLQDHTRHIADKSAGTLAACLWIGSLSLSHFVMTRTVASKWASAGVSKASEVRDGEWWRTLTALFLHADIVHLLGNLALGALLIGLLAAETGLGTAILMTLVGGALGNATNALIGASTHASIGASTAVFATLGALVGGRFRIDREGLQRGRAWIPLIAGLALLGWMGGPSERMGSNGAAVRTDVPAHVLGLLWGLALGFLYLRPGAQRKHEAWALAGAVSLIAISWYLAIS
jgi:membrane associated rhomboid family serine protease